MQHGICYSMVSVIKKACVKCTLGMSEIFSDVKKKHKE